MLTLSRRDLANFQSNHFSAASIIRVVSHYVRNKVSLRRDIDEAQFAIIHEHKKVDRRTVSIQRKI